MNSSTSPDNNAWPALAYADWAGHLRHAASVDAGRRQGEARARALSNHWWGIVLFVTARGLTTGAMPYRDRALQIDFDFCAHELVLRTSDAREQRIALAPDGDGGFLRRRDGGAARARRRCAHLDHAGGDRGRDPVRAGSRAREL